MDNDLKVQIRTAIHEAWNDTSGHGKDTFGMFLDRATEAVYQLVAEDIRVAEAARDYSKYIEAGYERPGGDDA
jgi:hypothetical protein